MGSIGVWNQNDSCHTATELSEPCDHHHMLLDVQADFWVCQSQRLGVSVHVNSFHTKVL